MTRLITFNELRQIKAQLPEGSIHRIADELNLDVETVRNFFGGTSRDQTADALSWMTRQFLTELWKLLQKARSDKPGIKGRQNRPLFILPQFLHNNYYVK